MVRFIIVCPVCRSREIREYNYKVKKSFICDKCGEKFIFKNAGVSKIKFSIKER